MTADAAGAPAPVTAADLARSPVGAALLALNNAHETELSRLTPVRLRCLVEQAFLARRVGAADALLLAFDQDAGYDSPNFLWFRTRFTRFVYVDRVVVALHARRRGHARALYHDLFRHAAAAGHDRIACEVNADPPNPVSDAFHHALGFRPVGMGPAPGGKTVRYLLREPAAAGQNGSSTSSSCCP